MFAQNFRDQTAPGLGHFHQFRLPADDGLFEEINQLRPQRTRQRLDARFMTVQLLKFVQGLGISGGHDGKPVAKEPVIAGSRA